MSVPMSVSGPDIETLLAAHVNWFSNRGSATDCRWLCSCGEQVDDDYSGVNIVARHRAHVAGVLRAHIATAQADAWDQGFAEGAHGNPYAFDNPAMTNPYRATLVGQIGADHD